MSLQTPHIGLTTVVQTCPYRLHTSVIYLESRCHYTDSTHQSDYWYSGVSIQSPHISLISCVQMCPYRSTHQSDILCTILPPYCIHTSVSYLAYRCVHTDSTHQSDNWCKDITIQTPHISLIFCIQVSPYRIHTLVWYLEYSCHYRDYIHQSDNWCTDVTI
jgi:hypothetical protein